MNQYVYQKAIEEIAAYFEGEFVIAPAPGHFTRSSGLPACARLPEEFIGV